MTSRHLKPYTVYLIGDHKYVEYFYQAAVNIALATDYDVINPLRGEEYIPLLRRLEMIQFESDVVVLLGSPYLDLESNAEDAFAEAVGKERYHYEEFMQKHAKEALIDCD